MENPSKNKNTLTVVLQRVKEVVRFSRETVPIDWSSDSIWNTVFAFGFLFPNTELLFNYFRHFPSKPNTL